jgi:hypothetical protein
MRPSPFETSSHKAFLVLALAVPALPIPALPVQPFLSWPFPSRPLNSHPGLLRPGPVFFAPSCPGLSPGPPGPRLSCPGLSRPGISRLDLFCSLFPFRPFMSRPFPILALPLGGPRLMISLRPLLQPIESSPIYSNPPAAPWSSKDFQGAPTGSKGQLGASRNSYEPWKFLWVLRGALELIGAPRSS